MYVLKGSFKDQECALPQLVTISAETSCEPMECTGTISITCTDNYHRYLERTLPKAPFLLIETFEAGTSDCKNLTLGALTLADGECHGGGAVATKVTINDDGSVTYISYEGNTCTGTPAATKLIRSELIGTELCVEGKVRYTVYNADASEATPAPGPGPGPGPAPTSSSTPDTEPTAPTPTSTSSVDKGVEDGATETSTTSSDLPTAAIVGAIVGGVVVIALVVALIVYRNRTKKKGPMLNGSPTTGDGVFAVAVASPVSKQPYLDASKDADKPDNLRASADMPAARLIGFSELEESGMRIPHSELVFEDLIGNGGFGQVYRGVWQQTTVALKCIWQHTAKNDDRAISQFLEEAKRCMLFTHPCIVTFYGVAWKTGADVCMVMEYMDGGDLRSYLDQYQRAGGLEGFTNSKVHIAFNIIQAIEYLHMQTVLHRDLKSANVLLVKATLEAKLTDFGVSRERSDDGMTQRVGTWRWMAPEILLGSSHYSEQADMWSFGVLLSELDTNKLPYDQAQKNSSNVPEFLLQQQITSGSISVEFSSVSTHQYRPLIDLAKACLSYLPQERPTASQARETIASLLQND